MPADLRLKPAWDQPIDLVGQAMSFPDRSHSWTTAMSAPAIPPPSTLPAIAPKLHPEVEHVENAAATPSLAAKKDEAVISKDGKEALATHEAAQTSAAKGLSAADAAALGQGLKRSNPAHFKQYDTNGDGKLSAQEAHAAGLG